MTATSSKNERYNAREAEARWQKIWADRGIFATQNSDPRPKYYVLEMFPYPSGRIHMGHVRNYTMGDVVARFKRAMGNAVLHPMGWDAFGMPAENAAIDRKVHPKAWTYDNIAAMKKQLQSMGLSLDWAREIATCDPAYYKHQQKMFLDFLKAGLVERKQSKVNWDPVDQTVLANEQVIDGRGWRSGAPVEQRELTQWFFKISDYSEDLLEALDKLDRWPDKVRLMQKNWIGRSEGLLLRFALDPATTPNKETELEIFTTRPDTLFGAKFMALSPDHPLATAAAAKNPKLAAFIEQCHRMGTAQAEIDTAEKLGFDTGMKAVHPFDANWKLPVYVANFILMDYGTGAIFGCPAHDQRDLDFVNKYGLGNTPVVCPPNQDPKTFVITDVAYDGDGRMINSRFLDGMTIEAVQVKHLMHDINEMAKKTFPKSIKIESHIANDLWLIKCSPTQIHQILLNLCVNARDAMPDGGSLALRAENCELNEDEAKAIPGGKPGRWLVMHVADTGTGMSAETLARIWEPFFTTKPLDKGTGLGLPTIRGIVETLQGFITVDSAWEGNHVSSLSSRRGNAGGRANGSDQRGDDYGDRAALFWWRMMRKRFATPSARHFRARAIMSTRWPTGLKRWSRWRVREVATRW